MVSSAQYFLIVALLSGPTVSGTGFLGNDPKLRAAQVRQELNGVLAEMLGHGVDTLRIKGIQEYLNPIFRSLPKNGLNHLSAPVMRYAVQRYFSQRHGWVVKGFEPHAKPTNDTFASDDDILQSKLPDFIRMAMEGKLSHQGFAIEDAAVMIAAVERLTFDEATRGVERAFWLNRLPVTSEMSREEFHTVVDSYFITEMLEGHDDHDQHQLDKANIDRLYPHWQTTASFVHDLADNELFAATHRSNPFRRKETFHFEDVTRVGQYISEHFGAWSNHECTEIRDNLAEMDPHNNGRVRLSDFYSKSLNGGWQFRESSEYLRSLGALDESSTLLGPQVLIANYVAGMSNCITSAPYYSICCLNQCDNVYQHLEASIPSSTASAAQIIAAVENIQYSAQAGVDAKNLTENLRKRLEEVAAHHGDRVPLHGRMLAQWLHYVFPRECPYPHLDDTVKPQTPLKYKQVHGDGTTKAHEDEVEQWLEHESARVDPSPEAGAGMWTFHENVLEASTPSDAVEGPVRKVLRLLASLSIVTCFALCMLKALRKLTNAKGSITFSGKPVEYDV